MSNIYVQKLCLFSTTGRCSFLFGMFSAHAHPPTSVLVVSAGSLVFEVVEVQNDDQPGMQVFENFTVEVQGST